MVFFSRCASCSRKSCDLLKISLLRKNSVFMLFVLLGFFPLSGQAKIPFLFSQNSNGYKTTCKSLYFLKKELRAYKVKEATLKRKQKIKHSTCLSILLTMMKLGKFLSETGKISSFSLLEGSGGMGVSREGF